MLRTLQKSLPLEEEPFFRGMNQSLLNRISSLVFYRNYDTRQVIYFPDDPCDYVYWLHKGRVRITRPSGDGRELTFRHLGPGDMIGEECLMERPKRNDYAEALENSVLCMMRTDDFRRIAAEEPELSRAVAMRLGLRVVELEQVLSETIFYTVRARIAARLLRLAGGRAGQTPLTLPITHQEMANMIGAARETVTVELHALRDEGLIELANRRVCILDAGALRQIAGVG